MTLDEYQSLAVRTDGYPSGAIGVLLRANELSSEAGEVAGCAKRIYRDDDGVLTPERRLKILLEIGDVLWGVASMANACGYSLSDVAKANIDKLTDRAKRNMISGEGDYR